MSNEARWQSAISEVAANVIRVRGYDIDELMEKVSFSDVIYLTLKGDLPDARNSEMFRAILVSSVDHGVTPPSTLAARTVMSAGNPLNAAVAAGILAIGDVHGGAIEQSAKIMQEVALKDGDPQTLAIAIVKDFRDRERTAAGLRASVAYTRSPRRQAP